MHSKESFPTKVNYMYQKIFLFDLGLKKKNQLEESGIWTNDLWIKMPALNRLSYQALCWRFPYCVNIFVRGASPEAIQPIRL